MKFTKEEINLCKQVVKKHKKPIEFGDWYANCHNNVLLHNNIDWGDLNITHKTFGFIPLWTISDCLEFFDEKNCRILQINKFFSRTEIYINPYQVPGSKSMNLEGKTPLEACLKAVLAVFEG